MASLAKVKELRWPAFSWGILVGLLVASPSWFLLAMTWRENIAGLGGLLLIVLAVMNAVAATLLGAAMVQVSCRRLATTARERQLSWLPLALPGALIVMLVAVAFAVRIPALYNEYAWGRANDQLANLGLEVRSCAGGKVRTIGPEFEFGLKLLERRQSASAEFANQVVAHTSLEYLDIDQINITDADLQQIARLAKLETLQVGSDLVTDRGATALGHATQLQSLTLKCPNVTDMSMSVLARLPKLDHLNLEGMPITDQGLWELRTLPKNSFIEVDSPHLTVEGLAEYEEETFGKFINVSFPWERDPRSSNSREQPRRVSDSVP
ncbi:leucine-rich repeat domain-containing protein [Anatilimnocola aggregata]|uniref:hypothetical protein n=1 Tax=Anatilimnocola aggregata TaxID=2528021 RepID=UPI00119D53F4|nr:hypothetical protein [Anatilimnocola aggregata]